MTLLFDAQLPVLAPVAGGGTFPVRRIFCVGRNYAAHAREMGKDPDREPPFFFTKWAEAVIGDGAVMPYPQSTSNFHYEAELVVAVGKRGRDIALADALDHVCAYAAGLDMTRRDLQFVARDAGRPWDVAKNFEASAPLGLLHPVSDVGHRVSGLIRLSVNGVVKQDGNLNEMIWPVSDIISILSGFYTLEPGDLIYTGTPAGVGPVAVDDKMVVSIAGLSDLTVTVGAPTAA